MSGLLMYIQVRSAAIHHLFDTMLVSQKFFKESRTTSA